jgi:putative peptide zinc metalloprotease protein
VLGIILFWIEVWYFMLRPVVQEFKEWYGMREEMNLGREQRITWGVIAGLVWILFLPHTSSLTLYGVIDANRTTPLFSKYDGEVKYVHPEGAVKQGELILEVESVDNRLEQERAQRKQTLYERQASNAFLSDETLQDSAVFDQSATAEAMRISAAKSIDEDMNIYAPSDGYLRYERKVSVGQFVGMAQEIGRVVDPTQNSITGFVEDVDMSLIHLGTKGEVLDTLTLKRFDVVVQGMEMSPVQMLDEPLLNSMYGGAITVGKENVPQRSLYKIRMDATMGEEEPLWFQRPAQIKLVVHYDSLIQRLLNATVSVFISQSAF